MFVVFEDGGKVRLPRAKASSFAINKKEAVVSPSGGMAQLVMNKYSGEELLRQMRLLTSANKKEWGRGGPRGWLEAQGFPVEAALQAFPEQPRTFNLKQAKVKPVPNHSRVRINDPASMEHMEAGIILGHSKDQEGNLFYMVLVDGSEKAVPMRPDMISPMEAGALPAIVAATKTQVAPYDILVTHPDSRQSVINFHKNRGFISPGSKVYFKLRGESDSSVAIGTLSSVDNKAYNYGGKVIEVPVLKISHSGGGAIDVNLMSPKYDVWVARDVSTVSLDEYKGFWVTSTDPVARDFSDKAMLMDKKDDVCRLKVIKDGMPWTISVPCSTVKPIYPTEEGKWWGEKHVEMGHPFSQGDVVEKKSEPGQRYVIRSDIMMEESSGPREGKLKAVMLGSGKEVLLLPAELRYVGRFKQGKVVPEPHFFSKKLAPPAPQKRMPDAE
jgi:hypothetical protein